METGYSVDAWWPGGLALATLAVTFAWLRRRTGEPGFAAFATAFAIAAALFLVKNPLLRDFGGTSLAGLAMAAVAAIAMVAGLCLFTGHEDRPWLSSLRLGAVWLLAALLLHLLDVAAPLTAHVSLSLLMGMLAVTAARSARREPGIGFGVIALGFAAHPLVVLLGWALAWPELRVRLLTWVPFAIAGTTLLVVAQMRARRGLERELERSAALVQAVDQLEAFNRMVSHDLRGPLAGVQGLAELARGEIARGRMDRVPEFLQLIGDQARRSGDLVLALLELARASRAELRRTPVPLRKLADAAVAQVLVARPDAQRVQWTIGELPVLTVDRTLFLQVLVNLLSNAAKFAQRAEPPRVGLHARAEAGRTVITVDDNGVGFDSSKVQLFEPFRRAHGARFEGSGVGLSIVRSIVERHGGQVWCESAPGQGARFHVALPQDR